MRTLIIIGLLLFYHNSIGNDGAYYGNGSHLVPISDSTISVKKEIISIKKISEEEVLVSVYYQFYNHGNSKKVIVGFEAERPEGDISVSELFKSQHPSISDFTVNFNNEVLPYKCTAVDPGYFSKMGQLSNTVDVDLEYYLDKDFIYVYYFNCEYKPGLNVLKHTYKMRLSSSVVDEYSFSYLLETAKRWKGKNIEDFTLIIDVGDNQDFDVLGKAISNQNNWAMSEKGEFTSIKPQNFIIDSFSLPVYLETGVMVFKQKNFVPSGSFSIVKYMDYAYSEFVFDATIHKLPGSFKMQKRLQNASDDFSKKVLRNWPFALQGYVFINPDLQAYYEKHRWYIANPTYTVNLEEMPKTEQEWIAKWTE